MFYVIGVSACLWLMDIFYDCFIFFFFFQAEDGIRDLTVTGVQTCALPIFAESVDYIATRLEGAVGEGKSLNHAIQSLLTEIIKEHSAIIFNGDNYTPEWQDRKSVV